MGWTWTMSIYHTLSGKVDRKAECDAIYSRETARRRDTVLKSAMRGSVYYAAVETENLETGERHVWAGVCLTSTRRDGSFDFGYKDMDETCSPFDCDCPKGILDLLTPTDYPYALEWRENCRKRLAEKRQKSSLSALPVGSVIEFQLGARSLRLRKCAPAYQFKRTWWMVDGGSTYFKRNHIPADFTVISVPSSAV